MKQAEFDLATALIFLLSIHLGSSSSPYCNIPSCGTKHTMCAYKEKGPKCKQLKTTGLAADQKVMLLGLHNTYRQRIATGSIENFPTASDMRQMDWDEELEQIAQRWASQCTYAHDECRNTVLDYVGQNLAYYSSIGMTKIVEETLTSMVNDWFDEYKNYSPSQIKKFTSLGGDIGHFTQMVWSSTNKLGCGAVQQEKDDWWEITLVCNYGPGGNYLGKPIYKEGGPCSSCPDGTKCSKVFPSLCYYV